MENENTISSAIKNNTVKALEAGLPTEAAKNVLDNEKRCLYPINSNIPVRSNVDREADKIHLEPSIIHNKMKVLTIQNTELLRLLESEELHNAKMASDYDKLHEELAHIKLKYSEMESKSDSNEKVAIEASTDRHLHLEEIRLLRSELDQVRNKSNEMNLKNSVELDSLQEHLRVVKEKQYQLLGKLQLQEEARSRAEDQMSVLEEKLRQSIVKASSAEAQLQIEILSRVSHEETTKKTISDNEALIEEQRNLTAKLQKASLDQLKLESDARETGEQLRTMAEKIFQLLERLKLAELSKTKISDALQIKEQELSSMKKKNNGLLKTCAREEHARAQLELDKKTLEDQARILKKQISLLGQRCKEEVKMKSRVDNCLRATEEKNTVLSTRVSFLLNRAQSEEVAKVTQLDQFDNMQQRLKDLSEENALLKEKIHLADEHNRDVSSDLVQKIEEIQALQINLETLQKRINEQDEIQEEASTRQLNKGTDNILAGGRLRFSVEYNPSSGVIAIRGKCPDDRRWLEENRCNLFLRKALKSSNFQELVLHKLAELYGIINTQEEDLLRTKQSLLEQENEHKILNKKLVHLHQQLYNEVESKRKTLLKYIHVSKSPILSVDISTSTCNQEIGGRNMRIVLAGCGLTDEDVHAIVAELRVNEVITEIILRDNYIAEGGCRALASLLSNSVIRYIDLRQNFIGRTGIQLISEALERCRNVHHVHIQKGSIVEAYGSMSAQEQVHDSLANDVDKTQYDSESQENRSSFVKVCVVDVSDNR